MKVAFIGNNNVAIDINTDLIISDNGNPVGSITPAVYAATVQSWGIDEDMHGHKCLTFDMPVGIPYYIDVDRNTIIERYYPVEFIGGRPPVIRK